MPQAAIVLAVVAAAAAKKQADEQARQFEFEAEIAGDLARRERKEGQAQAANFRRKQSRLLATARATRAGSGVSLGTGAPLLVDAETAAEIELGAQTILSNASKRAFNFEVQRELAITAARNKRAAAPFEAATAGGSTFLAAGGSFGGSTTTGGAGQASTAAGPS